MTRVSEGSQRRDGLKDEVYTGEIMLPDSSIRLNKYISESGICSRREADRFIEQGTQEEIYHVLRLNSAGIEQRIREFMA